MLKIILKRFKPQVEKIIAEEKAVFRARRSTTEQVFNLKILRKVWTGLGCESGDVWGAQIEIATLTVGRTVLRAGRHHWFSSDTPLGEGLVYF